LLALVFPKIPCSLVGGDFVEEQKLERDDEQQGKKQDEVRMGKFLGKNSADRFTD